MFTDTDHVLDYVEPKDGRFLRYMTRPFHAWEFALIGFGILLVIWSHPLFLAAVLGYTSHILIDQLSNRSHPLAYFLLYRAARRFRRRRLTPHMFAREFNVSKKTPPRWAKFEPQIYQLYLHMKKRRPS